MTIESSKSHKFIRIGNVILAGVFVLFMSITYGHLPNEISTSFGPSGARNLTNTSFFSWFAMPLLGFGTILYMYAVMWVLSKSSAGTLNFPYKKEILALSKENQASFLEEVSITGWRVMHLTTTYILVLLMAFSVQIYRYNISSTDQLHLLLLTVLISLPYGYILIRDYKRLTSRFRKKLDDADYA